MAKPFSSRESRVPTSPTTKARLFSSTTPRPASASLHAPASPLPPSARAPASAGTQAPPSTTTARSCSWQRTNTTTPAPDRKPASGPGPPATFILSRTGRPAPGTNGTFFQLPVDPFSVPVLNGQGRVAFTARVRGPGIDESNDSGIWAQDADGQLRLIVREGDIPQLFGPNNFDLFGSTIILNNRGQLAFAAERGIWATDLQGKLQQIVRYGDMLPFHHGFTDSPADAPVLYAAMSGSTGNEEGLGTSFNDRGELAFYAYSQHNNTGIFLSKEVAIPEPATLRLLIPLALSLYRRRNSSNASDAHGVVSC